MDKTIGIVCDNYKVETYKKELNEAGFGYVGTHPFNSQTTTIKVSVTVDGLPQLNRLVEKIEKEFKAKRDA